MALSNAERQRRYRERMREIDTDDTPQVKLNAVVDVSTKARLKRMAVYWGITQRAALERIIGEAERAVVDALPHRDQPKYYDGALRGNGAEAGQAGGDLRTSALYEVRGDDIERVTEFYFRDRR
ncbi:hypothetical protein F2Q65_13605 [Thiohalocapsa marina]|uniref:Uncharacterized protein n=1 Tax=Thiohalocapsa marina TaxID=424902 RepID=A0A5M8FRR6_9GAMM|nr:hypothetical protein [Thiohalocapsa marina]KAA6184102.1 hypothetical protein F2Q65_13605 [Thiohalocapsa marina]